MGGSDNDGNGIRLDGLHGSSKVCSLSGCGGFDAIFESWAGVLWKGRGRKTRRNRGEEDARRPGALALLIVAR